jgi:Ca2+-binding RTX toxin-like protein
VDEGAAPAHGAPRLVLDAAQHVGQQAAEVVARLGGADGRQECQLKLGAQTHQLGRADAGSPRFRVERSPRHRRRPGQVRRRRGPGHQRGRAFVAFSAYAWDLVAGDTDDRLFDVFVRDRLNGTTERVSVGPDGAAANFGSYESVAISADGRFVAFSSRASNLVAGDTNRGGDVFVRDRLSGRTERVSVGAGGAEANFGTYESVAISADGRFVAFKSWASNLVAGDTNGIADVFVRDRHGGSTERVSVGPGGAEGDLWSISGAAISADGRFVTFRSDHFGDVFVRDRESDTTERVSVGFNGAHPNESRWERTEGREVAVSADGRFVAFGSWASNLVANDTNGDWDVFVRDREGDGCTITGTAGDDVLAGTPGDDVICGLGGNDELRGGDRHDVLSGGAGDDRLVGASGKDWLYGGDGNDHLTGGTGADAFAGGAGSDHVSYFTRTAAVTVTIGEGPGDGEAHEGDDIHADVERVTGGSGDDTLTGDGAANRLSGSAGNDRLSGGGGHDVLLGGDGDDRHDAADGLRDGVSCGNGTDSALRDAIDWLSATCETRSSQAPEANGRVTFSRYGDIYAMRPDGSDVINLTASWRYEGLPAWSPDGRRLAFATVSDELFVMDAGGISQRVPDAVARGGADWSPDGDRLVFQCASGLCVTNPDGSNQQTLTTDDLEAPGGLRMAAALPPRTTRATGS